MHEELDLKHDVMQRPFSKAEKIFQGHRLRSSAVKGREGVNLFDGLERGVARGTPCHCSLYRNGQRASSIGHEFSQFSMSRQM